MRANPRNRTRRRQQPGQPPRRARSMCRAAGPGEVAARSPDVHSMPGTSRHAGRTCHDRLRATLPTGWQGAYSSREQSASAKWALSGPLRGSRTRRPARTKMTFHMQETIHFRPMRCNCLVFMCFTSCGRLLQHCPDCCNLRRSTCAPAHRTRRKSFQNRQLRPEHSRLSCFAAGAAICNAPCALDPRISIRARGG